jgi:hypothetical protein
MFHLWIWSVVLFCGLFPLHAVVVADDSFLAPSDAYNVVFDYADGSQSVNQTVQFYMSDSLSQGRIRVGQYIINVMSEPPVLKYRSKKVGTIPKTVHLHEEKVCLVQSTVAFQAASQASVPAVSGNGPMVRRLLEVAAVTDSNINLVFSEVCTPQAWTKVQQDWPPVQSRLREGWGWVAGQSPPMAWIINYVVQNTQHSYDYRSSLYTLANGMLDELQPDRKSADFTPHNMYLITRLLMLLRGENSEDGIDTIWCMDYPGRCFTAGYSDDKHNDDIDACALFVSQFNKNPNVAGFQASDIGALSLTAFNSIYTNLNASFLAQEAENTRLDAFAQQTALQLTGVTNSLSALTNFTNQVASMASTQNSLDQQFVTLQGDVQSQVQLLYQTGQNSTDQLMRTMQSQFQQISDAFSTQNDAANQKIDLLGETMQTVLAKSTDQFQQLYKGLLQVSDSVQAVASSLDNFIRQKQFNRQMTASYFKSLDALAAGNTGEIALVSRDGIRPVDLSGADLSAYLDSITITYTGVAGNSTSVRYDFYFDTITMLESGRPWTTIEQLFTWMGVSSNCIRRPAQNSTGAGFCLLWAERVITTCPAVYNWNNRSCSNHTVVGSTALILSLPALQSELSMYCLEPVASSLYLVSSSSMSLSRFITRSVGDCSFSVQDQLLGNSVGNSSILITAFSYLWMSYTGPFQIVLKGLELKRYGRLPNGIDVRLKPLGYTPSSPLSYNAGADLVQCMEGYWLSVSPETLPIYSITLDQTVQQTSPVTVSIDSAPVCSSSDCYVVTDADLKVRYVLQGSDNGAQLPSAMVVVGEIGASQYSGVYDVPAAFLETTSNTLLRRNLLSYLLMPANTTTTMDFSFFDGLSGGLFEAKEGSASAEDFRVPSILDNEGYPLCNRAQFIPLAATYQSTDGSCVEPFFYSGPAFYSTSFPVAPVIQTGDCSPLLANSYAFLVSQLNDGVTNFTSSRAAVATLLSRRTTAGFWFSAWITMRTPSFSRVQILALSGGFGIYLIGATDGMRLALAFPGDDGSRVAPFAFQQDKPVYFALAVNSTGWNVFADGVLVLQVPVVLNLTNVTGPYPISFYASTSYTVRQLKLYSGQPSLLGMVGFKTCELTQVIPRCWIPPTGSTTLNQTRWSPYPGASPFQDQSSSALFVQTMRDACLSASSGLLLSRSVFADQFYPTSHYPTLTLGGSYSLLMWMPWNRLMPVGTFTSVLWSNTAIGMTLGYDSLQQLYVLQQVNSVGVCRENAFNSTLFTALNTIGSTEFIGIVFQGDVVSLYRNGVGGAGVYNGNCAWSRPSYTSQSPPEMIYFLPAAISISELVSEMMCQLNTFAMSGGVQGSVLPATYSTPVAACVATGSLAAYGYCRHAMMCGGRCSALATLDHVNHAFKPIETVCDPGWLAPDCLQRCAQLDVNGYCVQQVQTIGSGNTDTVGLPGAFTSTGYWCQVLRNYQVSEEIASNGLTYVDFTARSYQYLTDIVVPSGQISVVVPTGICPSIAMQSSGDGSIVMIFTNTGTDSAALTIETVGNGEWCSVPTPGVAWGTCCTGSSNLLVPSYTSRPFTIDSSCTGVQITVKLNNGPGRITTCRQISAQTAVAAAFTDVNLPIPSNVQVSIVTVNNDVLSQIAANNQRLFTLIMNLQLASVQSLSVGIDNSREIQDVLDQISNIPSAVLNSSTVGQLTNPFNNNEAQWSDVTVRVAAIQTAAQIAVNTQQINLASLIGIGQTYAGLVNNLTGLNDNTRQALQDLHAQTNKTNAQLTTSIQSVQQSNQQLAASVAALLPYVPTSISNTVPISSSTMALLITGCVLGTISFAVLVGIYALPLVRQMMKFHRKHRRKEADADEEEEEEEENDHGSSPEVSETESGAEEAEDHHHSRGRKQTTTSGMIAFNDARMSHFIDRPE